MKKFKFALVLGLLLLNVRVATAADKVLSRPRSYEAITDLTNQFAADLPKIKELTRSFTVTQFSQSENYPGSMREYFMHRLDNVVKAMPDNKDNKLSFVHCIGCMSPRAISDGKDVFIRKGFVDNEEMKDTLGRLNAASYMVVNLGNSDDEAIMQISLFKTEDQQMLFSKEYKTALQGPDRTGVIFGIGGQSVSFQEKDYPGLVGGRLSVAQRLVGLGDIGIFVKSFPKKDGFPQMTTFGGFADLNYNEITEKRWRYASLLYPLEFGITDFNGDIQVQAGVGIKIRFGSTLYVSLSEVLHAFVSKPKHEGDVDLSSKEKEQDDQPSFKSNKPIPAYLAIGFGADF